MRGRIVGTFRALFSVWGLVLVLVLVVGGLAVTYPDQAREQIGLLDPTDGNLKLGESSSFDENVEVTVTDIRTTDEMSLSTGAGFGSTTDEFEAPEDGKYVLFEVRVENVDITERRGPVMNIGDYTTLEMDDDTIDLTATGVNDIRVYGSGEGGYLPDGHLTALSYDSILLDEATLEPYYQSPTESRPRLSAGETRSGWVYGLIEEDATPELRINFNGKSETWVVN